FQDAPLCLIMNIKTRGSNMKYSHIILGCLIALFRFLYNEDKDIVTTRYVYRSDRIPYAFHGYRIVQVSDFHNARCGRRSRNLLRKMKEAAAGVTFGAGDIGGRRPPYVKRPPRFIAQLAEILPTYYVTGNHEAHYKHLGKLERAIEQSDMQSISR